ncbi:MAG: DNA adenine methylase [Terriglobia bacterium]
MEALNLFGDLVIDAPRTEGVKYAGSKQKLLPYILSLVGKVRPTTVLDAFSGTTRVSQALSQLGYTVAANDIAIWSKIFASCYLLNELPQSHYKPIIDHLNDLPPIDGWFTEHYGGEPGNGLSVGLDGLKKPWQRHNTRRLDAIRCEIDRLHLTAIERSVLLTSLIRALDEVDNTLGHYASYLNEWSPRSYKQLVLKVPSLLPKTAPHAVFQRDVFELAPSVQVDLAYLDPPYGSNNEKMPPSRVRYGAYYHVWTSVILNDEPAIFGKANRRTDSSDSISTSVFEDFRKNDADQFVAVEAIRRLLASVMARHIILSYSSGGRATAEELNQVILENGQLLEVVEVDHRRNVMAGMRWTNEWIKEAEAPNREFLFLIEKT